MSMKLSYRDKVIIIIVMVAIVIGVGIAFFIKPQAEALQVSDDRLAAKQAEEAEVQAKMGTLETLKKTLEESVKQVEEDQKQFLNEREFGETYQINQYLAEKLEPAGLKITGMQMELLGSTTLSEYAYVKNAFAYPLKVNADIGGNLPEEVMEAYNANNKKRTAKITSPDVQIAGTLVNVSYQCESDEELFNAIQLIADNEENIYLVNASGDYDEAQKIADDPESEELPFSGNLTVQIYEIYPLDPADLEDKEEAAE